MLLTFHVGDDEHGGCDGDDNDDEHGGSDGDDSDTVIEEGGDSDSVDEEGGDSDGEGGGTDEEIVWEESDDVDVGHTWDRCLAPSLPECVKARLTKAMKDVGVDVASQPKGYYNFVLRLAQHFRMALLRDKDPLHTKRKALCNLALEKVCKELPANEIHPYSKKSCSSTFLPVLENLFDLFGQGPHEGSPGWLQRMVEAIDKVDFILMLAHPLLLKAFINKETRSTTRTDKDGYPIKAHNETVPDGPYDNIPNHKRLPTFHHSKSYKCVPRLPFVRKVSHTRAIRALKKMGLEPLKMDPRTRPRGKRWNNFARVLYTYWVHYCVAEGISRFDEKARAILLYLFHGHGKAEQTQRGLRRVKVLTVIHHACSWGKHQFAPEVLAKCFHKLYKVIKGNKHGIKFLTDRHAKMSLTYNACVEEGYIVIHLF